MTMFWVLVLVLFILWCGHRNKRQKAQDRRESIRTYGVPYIADPTRYPMFPGTTPEESEMDDLLDECADLEDEP